MVSKGRKQMSNTKQPFFNQDDVMTLEETAEYLKCHPVTLKRRALILHIPHKRLGSLWRFYRPSLEAWLRDDEDKAA